MEVRFRLLQVWLDLCTSTGITKINMMFKSSNGFCLVMAIIGPEGKVISECGTPPWSCTKGHLLLGLLYPHNTAYEIREDNPRIDVPRIFKDNYHINTTQYGGSDCGGTAQLVAFLARRGISRDLDFGTHRCCRYSPPPWPCTRKILSASPSKPLEVLYGNALLQPL